MGVGMAKLIAGPIIIIYYGIGFWGFILTIQYISNSFGGVAAALSVVLFPIAFSIAPLYAGLVDGYWTPALVSYSPVILYMATVAMFGAGSLVVIGWRRVSSTLAAIVIALIGSVLLRMVLGIAGGALGYGIATTTHIIWLPVLIIAAMNGAGTYIAFILAFRWIRTANHLATFLVVTALFTAGLVAQWIGGTESSIVVVLGAACTVASAIGGWIAVQKSRRPQNQDLMSAP